MSSASFATLAYEALVLGINENYKHTIIQLIACAFVFLVFMWCMIENESKTDIAAGAENTNSSDRDDSNTKSTQTTSSYVSTETQADLPPPPSIARYIDAETQTRTWSAPAAGAPDSYMTRRRIRDYKPLRDVHEEWGLEMKLWSKKSGQRTDEVAIIQTTKVIEHEVTETSVTAEQDIAQRIEVAQQDVAQPSMAVEQESTEPQTREPTSPVVADSFSGDTDHDEVEVVWGYDEDATVSAVTEKVIAILASDNADTFGAVDEAAGLGSTANEVVEHIPASGPSEMNASEREVFCDSDDDGDSSGPFALDLEASTGEVLPVHVEDPDTVSSQQPETSRHDDIASGSPVAPSVYQNDSDDMTSTPYGLVSSQIEDAVDNNAMQSIQEAENDVLGSVIPQQPAPSQSETFVAVGVKGPATEVLNAMEGLEASAARPVSAPEQPLATTPDGDAMAVQLVQPEDKVTEDTATRPVPVPEQALATKLDGDAMDIQLDQPEDEAMQEDASRLAGTVAPVGRNNATPSISTQSAHSSVDPMDWTNSLDGYLSLVAKTKRPSPAIVSNLPAQSRSSVDISKPNMALAVSSASTQQQPDNARSVPAITKPPTPLSTKVRKTGQKIDQFRLSRSNNKPPVFTSNPGHSSRIGPSYQVLPSANPTPPVHVRAGRTKNPLDAFSTSNPAVATSAGLSSHKSSATPAVTPAASRPAAQGHLSNTTSHANIGSTSMYSTPIRSTEELSGGIGHPHSSAALPAMASLDQQQSNSINGPSDFMPPAKAKGPNGAPVAPPQRPGIDRLIRKTVKITKGPYKGHRGTVKDTTIREARVELESKNKTVNIDKGQLSVIDLNTDSSTPYYTWASGQRDTGGAPPRMQAGQGFPSSRVPDGGVEPSTPATHSSAQPTTPQFSSQELASNVTSDVATNTFPAPDSNAFEASTEAKRPVPAPRHVDKTDQIFNNIQQDFAEQFKSDEPVSEEAAPQTTTSDASASSENEVVDNQPEAADDPIDEPITQDQIDAGVRAAEEASERLKQVAVDYWKGYENAISPQPDEDPQPNTTLGKRASRDDDETEDNDKRSKGKQVAQGNAPTGAPSNGARLGVVMTFSDHEVESAGQRSATDGRATFPNAGDQKSEMEWAALRTFYGPVWQRCKKQFHAYNITAFDPRGIMEVDARLRRPLDGSTWNWNSAMIQNLVSCAFILCKLAEEKPLLDMAKKAYARLVELEDSVCDSMSKLYSCMAAYAAGDEAAKDEVSWSILEIEDYERICDEMSDISDGCDVLPEDLAADDANGDYMGDLAAGDANGDYMEDDGDTDSTLSDRSDEVRANELEAEEARKQEQEQLNAPFKSETERDDYLRKALPEGLYAINAKLRRSMRFTWVWVKKCTL
ncbi:Transcription elongation factor spt5 [Cyphellophora attinorum]|uniref:Transcription elongation factor spt5 n=1 Tax=Cyphellophora attinorum TaxID=1664694 RepID=A0A0N1H181_9EURO|nr:Transcription elongation factor spt5 [Phialophora attinorum]KPI38006.1 Transcription elongation factor spt5 [Phialophora attinorum]